MSGGSGSESKEFELGVSNRSDRNFRIINYFSVFLINSKQSACEREATLVWVREWRGGSSDLLLMGRGVPFKGPRKR